MLIVYYVTIYENTLFLMSNGSEKGFMNLVLVIFFKYFNYYSSINFNFVNSDTVAKFSIQNNFVKYYYVP